MIDLERETLVPFGAAAKYVPRRRGRKVAATTLWRWITAGFRGVRLEGLRTPAGWATTVQAVQRFLAELARWKHERRGRVEELLGRAGRG